MSDANAAAVDGLSTAQIELLERACDRFEAAWKATRAPRIEDEIVGTDGLLRDVLLRELIVLDLLYRGRNGETPTLDEYRSRFPGAVAVAAAFSEAAEVTKEMPATPGEASGCHATWSTEHPDGHFDSPHSAEPSAQRHGGPRFRVVRSHARGGLGEVFVARDDELDREVALKEILLEHAHDPNIRARFLLEAQITGGLEHPSIVPVYGLGTYADGRPFYAMRFVRGDSLTDSISRFHTDRALKRDSGRRSLELRKLLRRFLDVCNAIEYAHSRGVLHRDIKPGNVIVGNHGETLLIDWGLAKATMQANCEPGSGAAERLLQPSLTVGLALTLPGSALGTPAYMSPEQAGGDIERLGPRSDVYGLGATLYCVLTGRPPFTGGDVLASVKQGEFPRPRTVDSTVDRALEAVCQKAMALRPDDRYATPRALADDVERWMAGEPVSAWSEPLWRRALRWGRRHRTTVAGAAAAVLVGIAGLAAVAVVQTRAKETTQAALLKSEESRTQAEAVSAFMVNALRSPDPSEDGRTIKMADVLDSAAEKLDKEFAGSAATKGALLNALGKTYSGLGLYAKSAETHAKALAVREAALGSDHPDTLVSRNNLAEAYRDTGRLNEAIKMHEANLAIRESKLGSAHPDTLNSRNNLADCYWAAGRLNEAIAIQEILIKLHEASLGPNHSKTLSSRNNLANAYGDVGRLDEAIEIHKDTLQRREAILGPDHPDTLISRNNLAFSYEFFGRWSDAEILRRDVLNRRRKFHNPDSPLLAFDLAGLGWNLLVQKRWSEAESCLRESLGIRAKASPDDWRRFDAMSRLGGALLGQGRYAEAEPLVVPGYLGLKAREAMVPTEYRNSRLIEAAERVVRLFEMWGKPRQATEWKAKLGLNDLPPDVFARR